jgi:hypothetical protein
LIGVDVAFLLNGEEHEKTFLSPQESIAQDLRGKWGNQWFIHSALMSSLLDEVINKMLEFADTLSNAVSLSFCLLLFRRSVMLRHECYSPAWLLNS